VFVALCPTAPILLPLAILLMLGDVFVRRRMIGD
jgi:hypothetical protein